MPLAVLVALFALSTIASASPTLLDNSVEVEEEGCIFESREDLSPAIFRSLGEGTYHAECASGQMLVATLDSSFFEVDGTLPVVCDEDGRWVVGAAEELAHTESIGCFAIDPRPVHKARAGKRPLKNIRF